MLNERIEACSEIADLEGLFFVWKNLCEGVTSLDSLTNLRLHHTCRISVNIDFTILLFEQLNIITLDGDSISLCPINHNYSIFDKTSYQSWFTGLLLEFLVFEGVIFPEGIKYDTQADQYILPHHSIKIKHACYRNLLIALGSLDKCPDGNFYMDDLLSSFLIKDRSHKAKITEETLLISLEEHRLQGEMGELYVIDYEQNRLALSKDKDKIKRISILDVEAGYDIISFNNCSSKLLDRFIEVKTYKGKPHFHWSSNEIQTAKIKLKNYHLYLVDVNKMYDPLYEPIIICDPISYFKENNLEWISSPESFLFMKII